MSRAKSVLTFVTGVPGVGKSYRQVYYLITEVIPEMSVDCKLYTNLPLNIDEISHHFKDSTLKERIVIIPDEEQKHWRDSKKVKGAEALGPWTYFRDKQTSGCILILDEIHELCINTDPQAHRDRWEEFLATVRHLGFMSVEFLTQAESEVARVIKSRAGIKVSLEDNESELDKFFKIPLYDWYNLNAKYTGTYKKSFLESTYKKKDGRWDRSPMKVIRRYIKPEYFKFYDSFNHTAGTETTADKHTEQKPYEKHSFIGMHLWFLKRNFIELIYKTTLVLGLLWFAFGGGYQLIFNSFMDGVTKSMIKDDETGTHASKASESIDSTTSGSAQNTDNNDEASLESDSVDTAESEDIEDESSLDKIVFISSSYIMTDKGKVLHVGDDFNGNKILKINYYKRGVLCSDTNFYTFDR